MFSLQGTHSFKFHCCIVSHDIITNNLGDTKSHLVLHNFYTTFDFGKPKFIMLTTASYHVISLTISIKNCVSCQNYWWFDFFF